MSLTLVAEEPPLVTDETGAVRVRGTRFLLDVLWRVYQSGLSPEEIVEQYDALTLPDVYAVIAYCLRHRAEVDAYLTRRETEAAALKATILANQRPFPTKAELLARKAADGSLRIIIS